MALSPSQRTLLIRILSAIVGLIFTELTFLFWGTNGLKGLCCMTVLWGSRELMRIFFKPDDSQWIKFGFIFLIFFVFVVSVVQPQHSGLSMALASILICSLALIREKRFTNLDSLLALVGRSLIGFFYIGLAPSFAFRLLDRENGLIWFLGLLFVVFAGDTLAYLTGIAIGKTPLLPAISPKKTIEGSLGGLLGSILSAVLIAQWLPTAPIWIFVIMGACVGGLAQLGDLFESLIKRIANRKDSGTLMPGHGGVLDRLDGVLFGAPVLFFFVLLLENKFF